MDQTRMRYGLTAKDEATGLDHTWFRKHENISGRWTTPDPIDGHAEDPQSFNRYVYVGNDPINRADPSGLLCIHVWELTTLTRNGVIVDQTITYKYSICSSPGGMIKVALKNPPKPKKNGSISTSANGVFGRFQDAYNRCTQSRKAERQAIKTSVPADVGKRGVRAGGWATPGGIAAGYRYGSLIGLGAQLPGGKYIGGGSGAVIGGSLTFSGVTATEIGRGLIEEYAFDLPGRLSAHEKEDNAKCEEKAWATVGSGL